MHPVLYLLATVYIMFFVVKKIKTPNNLHVSFFEDCFELPHGYYFNHKAKIKYSEVTNIYESYKTSNDVQHKTLVIIHADKKYYLSSNHIDDKSFEQISEILRSKILGQGEIEYKGVDQKKLIKYLIILSIIGFAILIYALFS